MVPISHAIGFYGTFLVTLAYNGTFYTMSAFNPIAANDLIERHKITYLFSVPTLYQAMVSAPGYKPEKMASLELVLYGGAPIMPRSCSIGSIVNGPRPSATSTERRKSCARSITRSLWAGR